MAKGGFKGGFPGMGGGNMNQLMQQAKKMQTDMARVQEEIKQMTMSGTSGGGAVKVTINGTHEILDLVIDPKVIDPEDAEMLQDLIIAAVNEANRELEEASTAKMNQTTGGLNLPF